jgi:hypothetical protein
MPYWEPIGSDLLGAKHIANSGGGYEPQRGHNFELLIWVPGGVGDAEIMLKSVETSLGISHNSEPLPLPYMNETVYIAGRPLYAPGPVVYRDMVNMHVYSMIESWYNLVYNPLTSIIGYAADYKSMGTLTMYDVKGDFARSWDLIGIWPQDVSQEAPSHVNGDIMRLNVTFQFDKAIPRFAAL